MENIRFSEEEIGVIRNLFENYDHDQSGQIPLSQVSNLASRLGKSEDQILQITEQASKVADYNDGYVGFEDLLVILNRLEKPHDAALEAPDPKVAEFLRILEEYRAKCEEEGNYLEAGRAYKQLGVLRKQEEKRQQKAILARHVAEKQDVQLAHNMQFSEFNRSWDKYMEEYDNMAQMYIQQMTERHAVVLLEFQKQLRQELASKPPKWSRELLDQRRKQHINARNKNYTTAQKLKKLSDKNEERERKEMEQAQAIVFTRREAKFRLQQQTELQALLKRIECRRKEHIKQRNLDTKRLLQRNRNVQAVLESKHNAESQKLFAEIKKTLYSSAILTGGKMPAPSSTTPMYANIPSKKSGSKFNTMQNQSGFGGNQSGGSYNNELHEKEETDEFSPNAYKKNFANIEDDLNNLREESAAYMRDDGPNFDSLVHGYDEEYDSSQIGEENNIPF
eukprot:gene14637-19660_t